MSGFVDSEADEDLSDTEFEGSQQPYQNDSEEEEEEKAYAKEVDDEGNIAGLVNDDSEEEEDEEDVVEDVEKKEKARRKRRRADHRLEDEDFELIEENLGVKMKKKKYDRLKFYESDDGDSDQETDQQRIQNQIFENNDFEDSSQEQNSGAPRVPAMTDFDVSGDEASDEEVDDFIVSDDEAQASHGYKPKKPRDAAMSQVQEIFGSDIDFAEIGKYSGDYGEDDEDLDDDYFEPDEDEQYGYGRSQHKKAKKPGKYKSIFDVMEPETLERGFYTDNDTTIRKKDVPERFQLRTVAVKPAVGTEDDLIEESQWINRFLFVEPTISTQEYGDDEEGFSNKKDAGCVMKIQQILEFIRNENFDVPYIAFYRKEYTEPNLKIHDLFKIYHWDEKWTQLVNRKDNMKRLFKRMQAYQYEQLPSDRPDEPLEFRALKEEDLERIRPVQTMEELRDIYMHFQLYYGKDTPKMMNALKIQKMRSRGEEIDEQEEKRIMSSGLKQASRRDRYTVCFKAGLGRMAEVFGLRPGQFAENLRDNYQRHETSQYPTEPMEHAKNFVCPQFPIGEDALAGARYMVALQLSCEPLVRQCVRQAFIDRAMVTVNPTKKGRKGIDEQHDCYRMKYLLDKPINTFEQCQYLILSNAEKEGLVTIKMHIDKKAPHSGQTYCEEIKQLYYRDEFSHLVQEWNKQRGEVIKFMLNQILYPAMIKEMKQKLLEECEDGIKEKCALKLRSYLSKAGYQIEENDLDDESPGVIAMGIAYPEDRSLAAFAAVIDGNGELMDYMKCPDIRQRSSYSDSGREKNKDLRRLKDFISNKKPHVIVIGVTDRFSTYLQQDIKTCVDELENEGMVSNIAVELMDNELSIVYSATNRAHAAFRDFPSELRQAISLARRIQEPLLEFSQLCTLDEDILCLKLHPMQDQLEKEVLLEAVYEEFIFRACEVGVDVNRAIAHPHTANIVQFVSGLGPRKAAHLLKVLKQKDGRLENRSKLVTLCKMGPKIFINCAGFIKIDTKSLEDSTSYIEVLDGLRVHPETYDWARKMAVDALEYDESADDNNPSSAISEILLSPERLKDLDLDAFAMELDRQGLGKRGITLYDIRNELNSRYKDFREPYRPPTMEQRFEMVTKEGPGSFAEGKLVTCQVSGIAYRRNNREREGNNTDLHDKDSATGLWVCSNCNQKDFYEISEVWAHVDSGDCPGKAVGVRTRFENGMTGFIPLDKLSDSQVLNPLERVKPGMTIHCRILKLDVERFKVDLSTRSSDLRGEKRSNFSARNDMHYDYDTETADKNKNDKKSKAASRTTYIKRVIVHPNFHNVDFEKAVVMMQKMDDGDVIIRPSSKGADHLKVTWRVTHGVCAHIEVLEEKKENSFSLGKSLWIGQEEFEDLDEIIARYIQPMASNARDLITHKYFREDMVGAREKIDECLKQSKKAQPSRIPYYITASTSLPGKFLISYQPKTRPKHEYVTVTPDGFRYRGQVFANINQLLKWFKEHFSDPLPAHIMQRSMMSQAAVARSSNSGGMRHHHARAPPSGGRHTPRTPKDRTPQPPPIPSEPTPAAPRTPHTPSHPYVTPDPYRPVPSHPRHHIPPSPRGTQMLPPPAPRNARAPIGGQKKPPPREYPSSRTQNARPTPNAAADWGRRAQEWRDHQVVQSPSPRAPRASSRTPVDASSPSPTAKYRS